MNEEVEICVKCRDEIERDKYTIRTKDGKVLKYHEQCRPKETQPPKRLDPWISGPTPL